MIYWKKKVIEDALKESPKEICGLLVNVKGKLVYKKCKNLAQIPTDQFILSPTDYALIEDQYGNDAIQGIVHSHPNTSPYASSADRVSAARTNKHWYIVNPHTEEWYDFFPKEYKQSLLGRPWTWEYTNCWQLVREFYKAELNINLIDFEKPDDPEHFAFNPIFEDCYEKGGFRALDDDEPMKLYDCPLMNFSGDGLNHIAVLCENNMLLHHPQGRLSCKEEYNRYYRSITGKIVRYVELPS